VITTNGTYRGPFGTQTLGNGYTKSWWRP